MADTKTRNPSVRQRRANTLRRTGLAEKYRIPLDAPRPVFYAILAVVAAFVMLGLVMVLSSSSITNLHDGDSAWSYFRRQLLWASIGSGLMWIAFKTPYEAWTKFRNLSLFVGVVVALNMAVIVKGEVINDARAWLDIGPIRVQPSEFMKIAMVLFSANLLSRRHRSVKIPQMVLMPMLCVIGVTGVLCVGQRDYGSAVIFVGTALAMMYIGGIPNRQLIPAAGLLSVLGVLILFKGGNASERMMAFLNLEAMKEDSGYQVYQSLLSIANGGLSGTGIGSGTSKWGYVPLAHSDFIFAVIAEELGLFGTALVTGGFFLLILLGVNVALHARDKHGALIAGGVSAWFGIQAAVNIGGVVGMMPMTGLTLPFLSYGGSSLMATMFASGLLLNVARRMRD